MYFTPMFSLLSSNIMLTDGKTWKMQIWFVQGSFEQVFKHARVSCLVLQGPRGVWGGSWPEADWKTARLLWSDEHPGEDKQGILRQDLWRKFGERKKIMFFILGMDLYIMRRRQAGIQIGRWKFEIYENRLAASCPAPPPSFRVVVALERRRGT